MRARGICWSRRAGGSCGRAVAETAALRAWALGIAARRGKRIAVVALARRLAGISVRDVAGPAPYDATRLRVPRARAA